MGSASTIAPRSPGANKQRESEVTKSGLRELFRLLTIETNPILVKWTAAEMGLIKDGLRLPLLPLEKRHHDAFRVCLQSLQAN